VTPPPAPAPQVPPQPPLTPPVPPPVVAPPTPPQSVTTTPSSTVDYSLNGRNWASTMCVTGAFQSPVNIDTRNVLENNKVKFTFDYQSYDNLTLQMNEAQGQLIVNISASSRNNSLEFWNQFGENFDYYLEGFQWKVGSEHTIDNRQYSAELQIIHKQFAT